MKEDLLFFFFLFVARGVPMKKKRKVDPQLVIMREQKKKRKIEKQIRRLEKYAQKLKPIEEIQISNQLRQETK